ncbi:hypothetical protein [Streptomyces sp. NPDC086787]|uniref:hypothetical protein n=1 Tax=Streptomyces sp. NPDC086787 TaxID=3365759 RepID=UPI003812B5CC
MRIAAATGDQDVIFDEGFNFVSSRAYERLTGDSDAFGEDWESYTDARATTEEEDSEGMGEWFDFGDGRQTRRRLPRLTELRRRVFGTRRPAAMSGQLAGECSSNAARRVVSLGPPA